MTQEQALDILKLGHNVYLTGAAGSGKTYVLNKYIEYLQTKGVDTGITASTGIAATHMGGVTIHSWSGLGIKDKLTPQDISALMEKQHLFKRFEKVKVLIIDEVSMLHHYRMDMVDEVLRAFKQTHLPFGGIQVILCGDFFQLPPISRKGEQPARFVYHSKVWRVAGFKICYLEEQHRQTDDVSLRILNDIRNNDVTEDTFEKLQARFKKGVTATFGRGADGEFGNADEYAAMDGVGEAAMNSGDFGYDEFSNGEAVVHLDEVDSLEEEVEEDAEEIAEELADHDTSKLKVQPTRLFTHNIDVDTINDEALDSIPGTDFEFYMEHHGRDQLVEALKKSCLAPEMLRLKVGARVMFVKNNFEAGYVNGTLGVIVAVDESGPTVRTTVGNIIKPEQASWDIEEDGKVKASIIQYPLRLAWAITIHKSQGMSLDAVEVDLSKSFEKGMGYVALSRVRSIDGLTILGINDMALKVHDEVIIVDEKLKAASDRAIDELIELDKVGKGEKERLQKEFLARVAAPEDKVKKISTFEKTKLLIEEEKSLSAIAKERGLTEETVIDHIEKLIEEDPFFLEMAAYLRRGVPAKKQKLIRDAFAKAFPDMAKEAGDHGSRDYNPCAYRKAQLGPVKHIVGSKASYKEIKLIKALG